jgi:hypothetical protein
VFHDGSQATLTKNPGVLMIDFKPGVCDILQAILTKKGGVEAAGDVLADVTGDVIDREYLLLVREKTDFGIHITYI